MVQGAQYIQLAQTLPPKLLRFFAQYPPSTLVAAAATQAPSTIQTATPNASGEDASVGTTKQAASRPAALPENNPFRSIRHPVTRVWHEPRYSFRRQADLVKLARQYGVEELLPPTSKKTEEKIRKREEHGLRVKGTGVGQRVKGHWRERTLKGRLEKRREAMLGMPKLVREWQQVSIAALMVSSVLTAVQKGHGRYWRKFPK
jgi:large subunit ribosomal protein L25